jgi:hypothetical protein
MTSLPLAPIRVSSPAVWVIVQPRALPTVVALTAVLLAVFGSAWVAERSWWQWPCRWPAAPNRRIMLSLSVGAYDVDFNPAADRPRVASDTGKNLRHDLDAGVTVAAGMLTYPPAVTRRSASAASPTPTMTSTRRPARLCTNCSEVPEVLGLTPAPPAAGSDCLAELGWWARYGQQR